jgi:TfoX/Sxy family transcriptional regulator of competence genes
VWRLAPLQDCHERWPDTIVGVPRDTRPMAYDEELAHRVREVVQGEPGVAEKRMFGGLAFLIDGKMAVSASSQGGLLLRIDPAQAASLIREPHTQLFEMRGRAMDGWLRIDVAALATDAELRRWVSLGVSYARSLPQKSPRAPAPG